MSISDSFKNESGVADKAHAVNITKDGVFVDSAIISPLTLATLSMAFGEPRIVSPGENDESKNHILLWDTAGIRGYTKDLDKGDITEVNFLFHDDPAWQPRYDKTVFHPRAVFSGKFLIGGKPSLEKIPEKALCKAYMFLETRQGNWKITFRLTEAVEARIQTVKDNAAEIIRNAQIPFSWAYVSYNAPRVSTGKFKHKKPEGEVLVFPNFNFKLAVVQELMYNQHLIAPAFDVYDFAKDYIKREIDVDSEGHEIIPEVKKWFKDLAVPANLAQKVESLYLDGGNDIYMQICPLWDGEDGIFDITAITSEELAQFPNLRRIENPGIALSQKASKLLEAKGVEIVG